MLNNEDKEQANFAIISRRYGSVGATMLTLIYVATNGLEWGKFVDMHVPTMQVVLWFYVMLVLFCLIPVIFGTFTHRAAETAKSDTFVAMAKRQADTQAFGYAMRTMVEEAGYKRSSLISEEELGVLIGHNEIAMFMSTHDIELLASEIFPLIDTNNDKQVTVDQFVAGCMWLKTNPGSTDSIFLSEQISL